MYLYLDDFRPRIVSRKSKIIRWIDNILQDLIKVLPKTANTAFQTRMIYLNQARDPDVPEVVREDGVTRFSVR